jgi:hypothetical protein
MSSAFRLVPDDIRSFVFCPRCGGVRKLVDVRREAAADGFVYPGTDLAYVIECCGYELSIDDETTYGRVVSAIKVLTQAG